MKVITRFAPSPTGFLHIGSARTAIFNYLFAKHYGGKYLLRIEDTDRVRSTSVAVSAIIEGLKWLNIEQDGDIIYQSQRIKRHQEIANKLLESGKAYYCYQTQEESIILKQTAEAKGEIYSYSRKWRDSEIEPPRDVKPSLRLKVEYNGQTKINDLVQGEVVCNNSEIEDLVLLRSDGTPTYMLAVVVDDHDMDITHVIRGDDHLTNSFKQVQIYKAMNWFIPEFAHIPLIHGSDGAKLSKRHGALGIESYKDMGYLPEALNNYLIRLGWSHGNDEFIDRENAIKWFNLEHVGKSPSRIDFKKLENVNAHYIKELENIELYKLIESIIPSDDLLGKKDQILDALTDLKLRARTINDIAEQLVFYLKKVPIKNEYKQELNNEGISHLNNIKYLLGKIENWNEEQIQFSIKKYVIDQNIEFNVIGKLLRIVLSGTISAPSIFRIIKILGYKEVIYRIDNIEYI